MNSEEKVNENEVNCMESYLHIFDNSGYGSKHNNSQVNNVNTKILNTSARQQEQLDAGINYRKERTNSQNTIPQMFKYPHTSIRRQEIFKDCQMELQDDDDFNNMEFPGSLNLSGLKQQLVSEEDRHGGLRIQSYEGSTFANHEGMTSHSVHNNKKDNSFNL